MTILKHFRNSALVAMATVTLTGAAAQAEQSYVMTCRGGGNMQAVAGQRVSNPHVFVEITYQRAAQGAAVQAPAPGECAWIDRGVQGNEPNVIQYNDMGVSWTQTICRAGHCRVNTPSSSAASLMNAVRDGQPFQVHVYNNRNGKMIVTHVGP